MLTVPHINECLRKCICEDPAVVTSFRMNSLQIGLKLICFVSEELAIMNAVHSTVAGQDIGKSSTDWRGDKLLQPNYERTGEEDINKPIATHVVGLPSIMVALKLTEVAPTASPCC